MIEGHGIVLKTFFAKKCKIILLDSVYGKIACVPNSEPICVGALIQYTLTKQGSLGFISHIEYLALPLTLEHHNLLFYHHVLELCYYFIPLDSPPSSLCHFVQQLLFLDTASLSYRYKIFFLTRLFLMFDMYPELPTDQLPLLTKLFARDIDSIIIDSIDLKTIDEMREWLQRCLTHHPLFKQFKTLQFLNKIEMEAA